MRFDPAMGLIRRTRILEPKALMTGPVPYLQQIT
jgi:hypothetical protein